MLNDFFYWLVVRSSSFKSFKLLLSFLFFTFELGKV
nr:MAG TPA: hypothetical protein [Caudoviricetes sp.]